MRFVYHLAEAANWPFIQQQGLWSAQALLERAVVPRPLRAPGQYRGDNLVLPDGRMLRDQRPMPPAALAGCLDPAMAPSDWYTLLNRKVFFWWDLERLNRHREACGRRPQFVLVVDLRALLERYGPVASVAPINTGYALRKAARRGAWTFVPYAQWEREAWASHAAHGAPRAATHPPAEFTVDGCIPDIFCYVDDVRELAPFEPMLTPPPARP